MNQIMFQWQILSCYLVIIALFTSKYNVVSSDSIANYEFVFFPNGFVELEKERRYLIINIERLGLINRLRSIVDWYFISSLANRTLIVNWRANRDCNVDFYDLFDNFPQDMIVLRHPIPMGQDSLEWVLSLSQRYNMTAKLLHDNPNQLDGGYLWGEKNMSIFASKELILSSSENILITAHDAIISIEELPCLYYFHQHRTVLSQFIPKLHIRQVVDQVMESYFINTIPIGVHIRMHDSRYDWEIIPPIDGTRAKAFGDGASIEDFIAIMKHLEQSNEYSTISTTSGSSHDDSNQDKAKPLIRFFVASNDLIAKGKVLKHFPTAISLSSEISRETIDGIDHAFMEWLVLSKCSLIIHTYASTFAAEAAKLNKVPLISIWEHSYLFEESNYLRYCGNIQFAKYFSTNIIPAYYMEGEAVNHRKVRDLWLSSFYQYVTLLIVICS